MRNIEYAIGALPDRRKCPSCARIVSKDELHGQGCLFCQGHY